MPDESNPDDTLVAVQQLMAAVMEGARLLQRTAVILDEHEARLRRLEGAGVDPAAIERDGLVAQLLEAREQNLALWAQIAELDEGTPCAES